MCRLCTQPLLPLQSTRIAKSFAGPAKSYLDEGPILRAQYASLGVHVVGIQEARSKERMYTTYGWYIIASGDNTGSAGCELWVNLHEPLEDGSFLARKT